MGLYRFKLFNKAPALIRGLRDLRCYCSGWKMGVGVDVSLYIFVWSCTALRCFTTLTLDNTFTFRGRKAIQFLDTPSDAVSIVAIAAVMGIMYCDAITLSKIELERKKKSRQAYIFWRILRNQKNVGFDWKITIVKKWKCC